MCKPRILTTDACPPPFDFTEAGKLSIDEIDKGIKKMERVNMKSGSDKHDTG